MSEDLVQTKVPSSGGPTAWLWPLIVLSGATLATMAVIPRIGSWRPTVAFSPELQVFFDKCKELHDDMSEQDVDVLLADYHTGKRFADDSDQALFGPPFKRRAKWAKTYHSRPNPVEGDWALTVYFDENGLLIGKECTEFSS